MYVAVGLCALGLVVADSTEGAESIPDRQGKEALDDISEIPVPPGAKDVERDSQDAGTLTAHFDTRDMASILEFYEDYLGKEGWTLFKSFEFGFADTRFYRKGGASLSLSTTTSDGEILLRLRGMQNDQETVSPEALAAATAKLPLPPGATASHLAFEQLQVSFSLSADIPKARAEDILGFYRNFFENNGWKDELPPDQPRDQWLDYTKGKLSASIDVETTDGGVELGITYVEYAHSREEFDTLVRTSATPEARALVQRVSETYASLSSYSDTGTLESVAQGTPLSRASFETRFVSPDTLLFEYTQSLSGFFRSTLALSKYGDKVRVRASYGALPDVGNDISLAIASLYGVSSTTSGNIPQLLLKLDANPLFNLSGLRLVEEAKSEDDTLCLRLQGEDLRSRTSTIWIGKDDLLIRGIDSGDGKDSLQKIVYHPKGNVEIADEKLVFRQPAAPKP
jgi:hypothetical protein